MYGLNSWKLPGRFSYDLGMQFMNCRCNFWYSNCT